MSLSRLSSVSQLSEPSENGRPSFSLSDAIACRVCDRVFFDNVSLVLHFECHVVDGYRLRDRDLASLRAQHLYSGCAPCSHSSLTKFSRATDCLSCHPFPVPSITAPNRMPRDPNLHYIPVINSSKPVTRRYGVSPLTCPSQLGARNSAYGPAVAPYVRGQNGGRSHFPVRKNQDIIVLSDDEEDENKGASEIDLTLKL